MPVRVSVRINVPDAGWSENIYYNANLADHNKTFWQVLADQLVTARKGLLHPDATIFDVRITQVGNARKVLPLPFGVAGTFPPGDAPDTRADFSWTRTLVNYSLANGGTMRNFLGGLPDRVTSTATQRIVDATWLTRFNLFTAHINSRAYAGYQIDTTTQAKGNILSWEIDANLVVVHVDNLVDFATGMKVRVSRSIMEPDLNRLWTIKVDNAGDLILQGSNTQLTEIVYQPGTGVVLGQEKTLSSVTGLELGKVTKHNPGRPFGLVRGRSRRKRRQVPLVPMAP